MQKLSSVKVAEVIAQVGPTLRAQQEVIHAQGEEITSLREKLAYHEKAARVLKLAEEMQAKGLDPDSTLEEKARNLMARDDIQVVEEAVKMSPHQVKLASVSADDSGGSSGAISAFEAAILE